MTGEELFGLLRTLDLPPDGYAVFGSGPLLIRGVIEEANDLDVVCRPHTWEQARRLGEVVALEDGVEVISVNNGAITFGRSWRYGDVDIEHLIDTADELEGIPFVRLEHVIAYKRIADRPKDRVHLAALAAAGLMDGRP